MVSVLDQYFTPPVVASRLASVVTAFSPKSVIDSNCGSGELLFACQSVHTSSLIYGIDLDGCVLKNLSAENPAWSLVHGDALDSETWSLLQKQSFCAAVLNPPFSVRGAKSLHVNFHGQQLRASPALAHVMTAIERGRPKVIAAILPESSASSEMDAQARIAINRMYDVEIIERLNSNTFPGASANAFIARMVRTSAPKKIEVKAEKVVAQSSLQIIRGGLPVFQRVSDSKGLPFIHSVHLRSLGQVPLSQFEKVRSIGRGVVQGHFVLFPRVGTPNRDFLKPVFFEKPVQFSDCVMGVRCIDFKHAKEVASVLSARFSDFASVYKGTGAKYISVGAAEAWVTANSDAFSRSRNALCS